MGIEFGGIPKQRKEKFEKDDGINVNIPNERVDDSVLKGIAEKIRMIKVKNDSSYINVLIDEIKKIAEIAPEKLIASIKNLYIFERLARMNEVKALETTEMSSLLRMYTRKTLELLLPADEKSGLDRGRESVEDYLKFSTLFHEDEIIKDFIELLSLSHKHNSIEKSVLPYIQEKFFNSFLSSASVSGKVNQALKDIYKTEEVDFRCSETLSYDDKFNFTDGYLEFIIPNSNGESTTRNICWDITTNDDVKRKISRKKEELDNNKLHTLKYAKKVSDKKTIDPDRKVNGPILTLIITQDSFEKLAKSFEHCSRKDSKDIFEYIFLISMFEEFVGQISDQMLHLIGINKLTDDFGKVNTSGKIESAFLSVEFKKILNTKIVDKIGEDKTNMIRKFLYMLRLCSKINESLKAELIKKEGEVKISPLGKLDQSKLHRDIFPKTKVSMIG